MSEAKQPPSSVTYYVDEAGDGVLFGQKGRDRLTDANASRLSGQWLRAGESVLHFFRVRVDEKIED